MITSSEVAKDILESWNAVYILKGKAGRAIIGGTGAHPGGGAVMFYADAMHNLPFLLACIGLEKALSALRDEGHFTSSASTLGALFEDSKKHPLKEPLKWQDDALILEIVKKRNDLAHRGQILPRADCWRYIEAIETELVSWRIVSSQK
jgi:hypothetical protein